MTGRDHRIQAEAAALWRQIHSGPPPDGADGLKLLELMFDDQPAASYERVASPHLRSSNIAFPKGA